MPVIRIEDLPTEIDTDAAIDLCYGHDLQELSAALAARQSVLVECDKLLTIHLVQALRRLNKRSQGPTLLVVDHRMDQGEGAVAATIKAFRAAMQSVDGVTTVLVVPDFDIIVTGDQTGQHVDLTAREVMALVYANPHLRVLAFKDPNLAVPRAVMEFFARRMEIGGVDRTHLHQLVTQREALRLDTRHFEPYRLFKYVSGLNVVKLRQIMQGFAGPNFTDGQPGPVLRELRQATIGVAEAELPNVHLSDIGGYDRVKTLLRDNILSFLQSIDARSAQLSEQELAGLERFIPRTVLFTGPPGTGKTMFCKALASELNATVIVVNGPELKSKWVGESEERIRRIFARARKCAPALIVFDEIDSFAGKRGGGAAHGQGDPAVGMGSQSDHSMLNQLLTEMDGFRSHESVFVIATTNFASSLDDALRSRMRFEIEIPYPNRADREAILRVYDQKYGLALEAAVMARLLDETERWIDQSNWSRFAGRDLEALASSLARARLLAGRQVGEGSALPAITETMAATAVAEKIRSRMPPLAFDDIGGYEDVKQRLREEILEMLSLARDMPADQRHTLERMIPKGVIFEGPPGTGKTMFAKALAQALRATISVVSGPELKSMWHGESERRIREIFAEARRNSPSVLVFDEIDSIAGDRQGQSSGVDRSMVNQLLTEMDGFRADELVFVVATTNFAASLDQALRRPGRFEYILHIGYPDEEARRAILGLYNRKYELGLDSMAIEHLVFRTDGWVDPQNGVRYSGDHIEAICRGVKRRKLRQPNWLPTQDDLDQIVAQRTKKPVQVTPDEEKVIATHEAGHAVVAMHTDGATPIRKISIASEYDGSLGYVLHGEPTQRYVQDERQLRAQIVCLMGGRVGERLVFGRVASGGSNDIEKATLIATHLVASFGMDSTLGPRMILHPLIHGDKAVGATSSLLLGAVEERVANILRESENEAERVLTEHRHQFDDLRAELIAKKTVEFGKPGSDKRA